MWGSSAAKKGWKTRGHDVATLEEVGIAKKQAERWQVIGNLNEKTFESYARFQRIICCLIEQSDEMFSISK